jgi:IS5 family transposase
MAFKNYNRNPGFLDLELERTFGRSRTQQLLKEIDGHIDWEPIDVLITEHYPVGQSTYGNKAYPPLMLLKAVLLQKWFGIASDPELENQINDRLSFKAFLGLPFSDPAPDHSIISRFRSRLGMDILETIHHELLMQFQSGGFSIESGMAVDARLVKSASRPLSKKKLREEKAKRTTPEGRLNKKGTPLKYCRDIDSDWTVKNNEPVFGMKEHAAIDVKSGLVLSTCISKASEHDYNYFEYSVTTGIHGKDVPPKVYADKGYCGKSNRDFLHLNEIGDGIMRKDQVNATLTPYEIQRNRMISKIRYKIEQYFGLTEKYQRAGRARFTTLVKEWWDHLCGAMAFNIKRVTLAMRKRTIEATV